MKRIINDKGAFDIRPAERNDLDYILSTWQLTWEKSPEMDLPGMLRDQYFRQAHAMLDELIPRCSAAGSLYICHETGAPHIIRGYLAGEVTKEPEIAFLHWVQVKKPQWNSGVASALMEAFMTDFGITDAQNVLYTFTSRALRKKELVRKASDRYNLVAWPWGKYELLR